MKELLKKCLLLYRDNRELGISIAKANGLLVDLVKYKVDEYWFPSYHCEQDAGFIINNNDDAIIYRFSGNDKPFYETVYLRIIQNGMYNRTILYEAYTDCLKNKKECFETFIPYIINYFNELYSDESTT